jgi:hypothetical protein
VDELLDAVARDLRDEPRVMGLLAEALRATGGDVEPAVDLVMLRLCRGRSEDGEAADALGRAGVALARAESVAAAGANAEEARRVGLADREASAGARASLRELRARLGERRRASRAV